MKNVLKGLQPEDVFHYFEALNQIPRESGNEQGVSDYLVKFANENGLEVIQEPCLNVIIKKPASKGKENAKHVILQGHMDMVCVKTEASNHDFLKDPIPMVIEGDYIKTDGTTLGADNGIAVAMAMAILADKDAQHPALDVIITVGEEAGMNGAFDLNSDNVEGEILINLDSEEEGVLLASCAGGVRSVVTLATEVSPAKGTEYAIKITGLKGGHSGIEIHKGRGNANKIAGRILAMLPNLRLKSLNGGDKMNAISKDANMVIVSEDAAIIEKLREVEAMIQNEIATADPDFKLEVKMLGEASEAFTEAKTRATMSILRLMPQGVSTMSLDIEGLVESSNNIGVVRTNDASITFESATRSSVKSLKKEITSRIEELAALNGATIEYFGDYPEWQYKRESHIRDLMCRIYKEITGEMMDVQAIHAGLECGLLTEKVGDIDMISLGPEMHDVHTPYERLSISSTERVYNFVKRVLKEI